MRQILTLGLLAALCGCSQITDLLVDKPEDETVVAARAAPPAPPPDDSFCRNVAMGDVTGKGFDEPTQKLMAQQSYLQCQGAAAR